MIEVRQVLGVRRHIAAFAFGGLTPHTHRAINQSPYGRSQRAKAPTSRRTPRRASFGNQAGRRMRLGRGLFLFRRARRETVGEETDDWAALTGCFVAVSLSVPPALAPALL
jgi:hypothetical protein